MKSLDKLKEIHNLIRDTNNLVIKETENLRIILLNLKIENARIKENTGIDPICLSLEKAIVSLHDNVKDVVDGHRQELKDTVKELEEQLKNLEGVK